MPWPRASLDRGSFARFLFVVKMVIGAVSGWTTGDINTVFCMTLLVSAHRKRPTIGPRLR